MTTRTDADFWLNEATAEDDICDKRLNDEDFLRLIIPEVGNLPKYIVEIGCGIGRLTNKMQELYPDAEVTGIDINPQFLKIASQRGSANYILADNLDDCRGVDFIYSVLVFQHLDSKAKQTYIRQAGRALRKGGTLFFQYVEGDHASRAMYDAKIADVRLWCEEAGLEIENIKTDTVCERWTWVRAVKK